MPRVLLAVLAAAAVPGAIGARDNGGQAAQDGSGTGTSCVTVMGKRVCKSASASVATAAVAPAMIAARLFAEGPALSPDNDSRTFAIQGFARSGWPVAVDFLPQPNSLTLLVVTPYDPAPPGGRGLGKAIRDATGGSARPAGSVRIVMDPDGRGGRRLFTLARLDLPAPPGAGGDRPLGIATYTVESYRIRAKGKPSLKRAPVEIFGFGAGPEAVGDAAAGRGGWPPARAAALALAAAQKIPRPMPLSQALLADSAKTVTRPKTKPAKPVNYQYRLRQSFHFVAEDIWLEKDGKAVRRVFHRVLPNPRPADPLLRQWMLGPAPDNVAGQHRLLVSAWLKCTRPDFASCKDADFSVARSSAVAVK